MNYHLHVPDYFKQLECNFETGLEMMKAKNKDYSGNRGPFASFELSEQLGICSVEQGMVVRMSDKLSRISTLLNSEAKVEDEKIRDTLGDLMNYCNIMMVYLDNKEDEC